MGVIKFFDVGVDGYCCGEGVGLVVFKSLLKVLVDGDIIFGIILFIFVK